MGFAYMLEQNDSVIAYILEIIVFLEIPLQIEAEDDYSLADDGYPYNTHLFTHYGIENITDISYNPTCQAVMGRSNSTFKEMLVEQKKDIGSPRNRLLTLNILNVSETEHNC